MTLPSVYCQLRAAGSRRQQNLVQPSHTHPIFLSRAIFIKGNHFLRMASSQEYIHSISYTHEDNNVARPSLNSYYVPDTVFTYLHGCQDVIHSEWQSSEASTTVVPTLEMRTQSAEILKVNTDMEVMALGLEARSVGVQMSHASTFQVWKLDGLSSQQGGHRCKFQGRGAKDSLWTVSKLLHFSGLQFSHLQTKSLAQMISEAPSHPIT